MLKKLGFEKIALNIKELRLASKAVKRNLGENALWGVSPAGESRYYSNLRKLKNDNAFAVGITTGSGLGFNKGKELVRTPKTFGRIFARADQEKLNRYKHTYMLDSVLSFKGPKAARKIPEQFTNARMKEVNNRLAYLHEASEVKALKKLKKNVGGLVSNEVQTGLRGHVAPSVLLREHNAIVSMSNRPYKQIKDFLTTMRRGEGFSAKSRELKGVLPESFVYGASPRLSRHEIKRIDELFFNKNKKLFKENRL